MYTIGLDFGTLSGRAVLVDTQDGTEIASAVYDYPSGVIDQNLPGSDVPLPPDWALQDPADYFHVLEHTIPKILRESGISKKEVIGIGLDVTSSTSIPVREDGTPLSMLADWRHEPHAWVKLWKHHAAQEQANRMLEVARSIQAPWLVYYGGKISSEWLFGKALQMLEEAPAIYSATDRLLEVGDWLVWQLTGQETRSWSAAGYKALFCNGEYPPTAYFRALHPGFADIIATKMVSRLLLPGQYAGGLTQKWAAILGLMPGTPVATANIDAHVTASAVQATKPGSMVMIMGTSTCHIISSEQFHDIPGIAGAVQHGIVPGLFGYEAGQTGVGDIFAWFTEHMVPPKYHEEAQKNNINIYQYLESKAAQQTVSQHGLIALDWWNGNRSTLMDANLTGLLMGMTLATRAEDIYRALLESTAYGTRHIIESFSNGGVKIKRLIVAGGLPPKSRLLCQIYADVTGVTLQLAESTHAPALGSAIHAAVAAGAYKDIHTASEHMGRLKEEVVMPIAANQTAYEKMYTTYMRLHDYLGIQEPDLMHEMKMARHNALQNLE